MTTMYRGSMFEVPSQEQTFEFDSFAVVDEKDVATLAEIIVMKQMRDVKEWDPDNVETYITNIGKKLVEEIADFKKPFKFLILIDAGPKMGAAMEVAHIQHWEPKKDGYAKFAWSNPTMFLWVTIYWVSV